MVEQILNMNQLVQIELTNYGKEIYKKYYEDLGFIEYAKNADEKITIPLWEISKIFHEAFYNGNAQVPFLNNSLTLLNDSISLLLSHEIKHSPN